MRTAQAIGGRRLQLPGWHAEDRAAKVFGEIGAVDKAQRNDPSREGVDLEVVPAQQLGQVVEP
ncbi:hypothetical protein D3C80_2082350 [compost metagenome]